MTTKAASAFYLAEHQQSVAGRGWAVFNPNNLPVENLPTIFGFNNGGGRIALEGLLVTEDGTWIGGHGCSHEGYMPNDLGILEGSRPDRHEAFRKHYPDGYRMEFVGYDAVDGHERLNNAIALAEQKATSD